MSNIYADYHHQSVTVWDLIGHTSTAETQQFIHTVQEKANTPYYVSSTQLLRKLSHCPTGKCELHRTTEEALKLSLGDVWPPTLCKGEVCALTLC